jgi:hypothetical protein
MWYVSLWNWPAFTGGIWNCLEKQARNSLECCKWSSVGDSELRNPECCQAWWCIPAISAILEGEMGMIKASPSKKLARPISTNKLGMVMNICNPSYAGGIGRRLQAKARPYLKNN